MHSIVDLPDYSTTEKKTQLRCRANGGLWFGTELKATWVKAPMFSSAAWSVISVDAAE